MGFQDFALVIIGVTNFINSTDDARKLIRCVVIINDYIPWALMSSDLIELEYHIFVSVAPVKEGEVDTLGFYLWQFQPGVALVEEYKVLYQRLPGL